MERLRSPLASVLVGDGEARPAAAVLEEAAREEGLDVRVLLTKLQVEQSLLTSDPTPDRLDWALGYGATDSGRMEQYRGFENQVRAAARTLVGYLDSRHPLTVVGLAGRPMKVSDGTVTPRNLATAALYRNTPWIRAQQLFHDVWVELFGTEPQVGGDTEAVWRLVVPPDNWRNPLPIPAAAVEALREAAARLKLAWSEDAARRKA
ncbi:MAG: hypothetical protein K8I02_01095, partial [Candidatus Methylomirabilis sp.]|nr:hypothetical protein [Deltaproteobacteria bacterium]